MEKMKNKCGILEYDYGYDCNGLTDIIKSLEQTVEIIKQMEEKKYISEHTGQKKFRRRTNLTPKKKKRR